MRDRGASAPIVFKSRHYRRRLLVATLVLLDVLMIFAAGLTAMLIRYSGHHQAVVLNGLGFSTDYTVIAAACAVGLPVLIAFERLYDLDSLFWGSGEFTRVAHATSLGIAALVVGSYLLKVDNISRLWLALFWVFSTVMLIVGRWAFRVALRRVRRNGRLLRPALIIGANLDAVHLARSAEFDHASGLSILGCLTSPSDDRDAGTFLIPDVPILGDTSRVAETVTRMGCDAVIIVASAFEYKELSTVVSELRRLPIDLHVSAGLYDVLTARIVVREMGGTPMMKVKNTTLSPRKLRTKRAFDIVFSSAVVLLGLPLWLLVAAAIKLDSRGPVFYQQERVGRGGELFGMYKFRSMRTDADDHLHKLQHVNEADGPLFKIRNDPRVTRVGRMLRKYSIDEIPQFLNVLLGHMSVVGPRPPLPAETTQYSAHHMKRLEVLPGVTGLWQVSGRSDLSFEEMVRLDLFYIENWSLRYDLALVVRTIPTVLLAEGAY